MEFSQFVEWVFYGLIGGCFVYGVSLLSKLKDSIDILNIQMATIIEKTHWFNNEINFLKDQVNFLKEQINALRSRGFYE